MKESGPDTPNSLGFAVVSALESKARELGTKQALAAEIGISPQYLCDIIALRKEVPDQVLEYLKMERRTQYVRIKQTEPSL